MAAGSRNRYLGPLLLIALGVVLLARNLGYLPAGAVPAILAWWPAILLAAGVVLLWRGIAAQNGEGIVPGTVLAAYGALFLLVPLHRLAWGDLGRYWGVFPGAVGLGFLLRYALVRPRTSQPLVPAVVLLLVGALGLFGGLAGLSWRYWPTILVAIGVILLFWRVSGRD